MSEYTIELQYPNENLGMNHRKLLEFPHVLPMDPDQLDVSFAYNDETVFLQNMVGLSISIVKKKNEDLPSTGQRSILLVNNQCSKFHPFLFG